MSDHYRVEVASHSPGCRYCGHDKHFTVIYTDPMGEVVEIGSAWGDREFATSVT